MKWASLHKKSVMRKFQMVIMLTFLAVAFTSNAQMEKYQFGKGFRGINADSTFSIKAAFRFQSLFVSSWDITNDDLGRIENLETNFLIRRARLKFDGFAWNPKLTYKLELGLSNRDIGASEVNVFNTASNVVMDAYIKYNFYKGFSVLIGQTKLPGNRERVISSANLQMVDRSQLNSRFNLDRDMGVQFEHKGKIGTQFNIVQKIAISQGEGRNVTAGNMGGLEYTYRVEAYPMGSFKSKGDYSGTDLAREQKPKLAIGATFDINDKAGRNRGNLGSFFLEDSMQLKTLYTGFVDMMFKYKGFSMMGEFAIRGTDGNDPTMYYANGAAAGTYYTGSAVNLQTGYLFKNDCELSVRYTNLRTQNASVGRDLQEYTLGFSRYIVGHSLKIQTDLGYRQTVGSSDGLQWRLQFDFHL